MQVSRPPEGLPCGSAGKESSCCTGALDLIPGLGRSPGEGKGYPLQYSSLENSMDYRSWDQKESDTTEGLSLQVPRSCAPGIGDSGMSVISTLVNRQEN